MILFWVGLQVMWEDIFHEGLRLELTFLKSFVQQVLLCSRVRKIKLGSNVITDAVSSVTQSVRSRRVLKQVCTSRVAAAGLLSICCLICVRRQVRLQSLPVFCSCFLG